MAKKQQHTQASKKDFVGNGSYGRIVLLSGSPGRSKMISKGFTKITKVIRNERGLVIYLGYIDSIFGRVDLAAATSGMGVGSTEIVTHELLECGVKNIIRVGSSGTLNIKIRFGDLVITLAAIRDDGASENYAPVEFPAVAHILIVRALINAAIKLDYAKCTFSTLTHTKRTLFAREGGAVCPNQTENLAYKKKLTAYGTGNSEMEIAIILTMIQCRQPVKSIQGLMDDDTDEIRAGAICVVFNDFPEEGEETLFSKRPKGDFLAAEQKVCEVALQGAIELYGLLKKE